VSDDDGTKNQPEPQHYLNDQKRMNIGEQTDKEVLQNFLTGDFCVHGVSLVSYSQTGFFICVFFAAGKHDKCWLSVPYVIPLSYEKFKQFQIKSCLDLH